MLVLQLGRNISQFYPEDGSRKFIHGHRHIMSSIASPQHEEYNSFFKESFKLNFLGINIPVTGALLDLAQNAAV
jgi:hypothetical protein